MPADIKTFALSHRNLFLNHLAQTNAYPLMLEIIKADGCILTDINGKEYIDLISGISVSNAGHGHEAVVKAVKQQAERFMHTMVYGEFVQAPQTLLAKALAENLPPNLHTCYFVNSGSEAIEGALKLAKRFTGRTEIVAFKNAYHGSTHAGMSLMSDEHLKNAFRPLLPGVRFIDFNHKKQLDSITAKTACVVAEVIQGEAGAIVPDIDFHEALRKKCDETKALLIFDEVQTAIGRTGTLFAFEQFKCVPDILVLAKSLGGGMPLGAFISSKEIMSCLSVNPALGHITTFGGHPVSCAAGLAAFNVIKQMDLKNIIAEKENIIRTRLVHPAIKNISGKALLLAVEFDSPEINRKAVNSCVENGVITDWFLFAPHKMRVAPPLLIENDCLHKACDIILKSINQSH